METCRPPAWWISGMSSSSCNASAAFKATNEEAFSCECNQPRNGRERQLRHRHTQASKYVTPQYMSYTRQRFASPAAGSVEPHPTVLPGLSSPASRHAFLYAMGLAASRANASSRTGSFRIKGRLDARTMISAKKPCGIRWHDAGLLLLRPCTARACHRPASMSMQAMRESAGHRHSRMQAAAACV